MFKNLFCKSYDLWLSRLVSKKTDPLVVALDYLFGSECKYCFGVRSLVFGFGIGLWNWFSIPLVALVLLMTYGERNWLCKLDH